MRSKSIAMAALVALCAVRAQAADQAQSADQPAVAVGSTVADFTLKDYRGQSHTLSQVAKDKTVVLAFLGTECPLCKLYAPRLAELAKEYDARGVAFIGIDSNRQDAVTEIAAYARVHGLEFPILKDLNQTIADRVGVKRTPEVVVLDAKGVLRYRGRIDDQYGFQDNRGYQKNKPTERDLAAALEQILAGKEVAAKETKVAGCLIGRDRKAVAESDVTYCNQVSRILNANCVYCHREKQIAPFALTNYEEAVGWAGMIDEVVQEQRMPPWHADERYGHFKNDARLSDADKATIARWVANGAPEGNRKDLPEPPKFAEGWLMPKPEQVLYMRDEPFEVKATGVLDYQMFVVDPGWKEDKWISAVEPRPDNHSVVHHILLFVLPPDGKADGGLGGGNDFLAAYAPGLRPEPLPPGQARRVPAGSKLIFQMHYTPNGSVQKDRSYCGFTFADPKTVQKEVRVTSAVNFVFSIPPGSNNFGVNARYVFREDTLLISLMPHMHLRGKAFRYEAAYPDGTKEILLDVPHYDFGWQTSYRFNEPKMMPAGTRLDCVAHFDNSADNPSNPNPKVSVRFGDQTFEEMMIGFFESTTAHEDLLHPEKAAPKPSRAKQFEVIMKATGGQLDDNLKKGASFALMDPGIFRQFGLILQSMTPQVDRVCITAAVDGQLTELFSPAAGRMHGGGGSETRDADGKVVKKEENAKDSLTDEQIAKVLSRSDSIRGALPKIAAEGEGLADFAAGKDVVVVADVTKAKGKVFELMAERGVKSSMHVPAKIKGKQATINFWSTDPNAFNEPAQELLTRVAKIMATPSLMSLSAGK